MLDENFNFEYLLPFKILIINFQYYILNITYLDIINIICHCSNCRHRICLVE